ncbi:MAG: CoA-binding protein [Dehalococcoidia bacterium]|nr:CoA-binding protein [Dehalococcoidia bacterium]
MTDDRKTIAEALEQTRTIAVIGMREHGAAAYVPQYMEDAGYDVTPVNPVLATVFGKPALDSLDDLPGPIDMVTVFRRSEDVPGHLDEILRAKPRYVWMQSGIRSDAVADKLAAAGIKVVQDRCLMVEHRRLSPA